MKKAYLFKIRLSLYLSHEYLLAYGENEKEARKIGAKELYYDSGDEVLPNDLKLVTYGL